MLTGKIKKKNSNSSLFFLSYKNFYEIKNINNGW